MIVCEVCGNTYSPELGSGPCPYCQSPQLSSLPSQNVSPLRIHREVNLERGLPRVAQAISQLEEAIASARREGLKALTLIHGYGSSGAGGAIRTEVRAKLAYLEQQGKIQASIPGEDFEDRSPHGRQLKRRFPFLQRHRDLNRVNRGITIVFL
jgi:hypothetical protein